MRGQYHEQHLLPMLISSGTPLAAALLCWPGGAVSGLQLGRSQVVALLRQGIMRGALGGARGALIKWLLEAGSRHGPDPSPATVRALVKSSAC